MTDISRDELDFLSDIRPMAGPATHICWTPDGVPPEKRVVMVLVPADEFHAMKRAIRNCRAALDAAEAAKRQAVLDERVKPLVWRQGTHVSTDDDGGRFEGIPRSLPSWTSWDYKVIRQLGEFGRFILSGKTDGIGLVVLTLNEAKAAAQADHDARIRSALEE